ncbi:adenylate cyclase [Neosynechococcus sphagnicola sy1]|uniref:Adenylate cyclase n=1 Tax=Neosynechococcus sphagnicola sy1 TaxID=1497020 RepID=A0A098TPG7_9CYAN|nr:adenylate/guanylate cyclase domain-containing protein [Neosynechococcus sphagnicola]KGF72728.1 adenylate cyclase [Neosynechococcus sphagnicola sy1]
MANIHSLPDQRSVEIDPSETILEALLNADIPHTHVCGGHAYCSTCRVMILKGIENCSPTTTAERTLARKLEFPFHIRLACQTRVTGDVSIRRMVIDNEDIDIVDAQLSTGSIGTQKTVAVLFASIRGATNFDEVNFPYDMIYILSRYFHSMNQVVNRYGGVINNYMGIWCLAIFGLEDTDQPVQRAVWSGLEMLRAIRELNDYLKQLSYQPLQLTLGVHYGPAVIVPVDPSRPSLITAAGNAVNLVSRIEAANREVGSQLLVSEAAYAQIQAEAAVNRHQTIAISGSRSGLQVYEVVGMKGEPPVKLEKADPSMPLTKRVMSFMQKFAGSWGKNK